MLRADVDRISPLHRAATRSRQEPASPYFDAGGPTPSLSPGFVRRRLPVASRLYWTTRKIQPLATLIHRLRRRRLLLRVQLDALWYRSAASVSIAPDVSLGKGVRIIVSPGSRSVLEVGSGTLIGDNVEIRLEGGQALIGKKVDIRRGSRLVVGGLLELVGPNMLQAGCSIHCHERITIAPLAALGEYVTVVDSVHYFTTPDEWFLHNVRTAPVSIGYNAWLGAKATIARGGRIGDHAIVAANSLVTTDVPAGHLASGVPAEVVRPVKRPWLAE